MAHNRKLVLGAVSLTLANPNPNDLDVMAEVRGQLEQIINSNGYLNKASFKWVGLILRYGL